MFTMNNADNGLGSGSGGGVDTIKIDLTNYALKEDTATKVDLEALKTTVAGKIDKEPQHHHTIAEVDELQAELNAKYDTSKKYSYNVILSDSEKIPYLEDTKIINLDITTSKETSGYVMKMDNSSGDFQVLKNNVAIMSYNSALNHWIISGNDLNNFMTNTNDVLKNHYDALVILGNNHSQTDTNPDDGDKITLSPSDGGTGGDTGGSSGGGDTGGSTGGDSGTTTTPTIYHKEYTFTDTSESRVYIPICTVDTEYFKGKMYVKFDMMTKGFLIDFVYSSVAPNLSYVHCLKNVQTTDTDIDLETKLYHIRLADGTTEVIAIRQDIDDVVSKTNSTNIKYELFSQFPFLESTNVLPESKIDFAFQWEEVGEQYTSL